MPFGFMAAEMEAGEEALAGRAGPDLGAAVPPWVAQSGVPCRKGALWG